MKQENRNKGRRGEAEAAKYLANKGYQIIERNWGNKFGEIDIIAMDGGTIVFVEVKAKTGEKMGLPEEMVGKGKIHKIKQMAVNYLGEREVSCRIEVVAIVLDQGGQITRLTHYQDLA